MDSNIKNGSIDSKRNSPRKQEVPLFCDLAVRHDGKYEAIELNDIVFIRYPDFSYFIRCKSEAVAGMPRAILEFRGEGLKDYTTYPISVELDKDHVNCYFEMSDFSGGFFSDPEGTFNVRRTHESDKGFWFIAEFTFSVTFYSGEEEIEYAVESTRFQVQVNV